MLRCLCVDRQSQRSQRAHGRHPSRHQDDHGLEVSKHCTRIRGANGCNIMLSIGNKRQEGQLLCCRSLSPTAYELELGQAAMSNGNGRDGKGGGRGGFYCQQTKIYSTFTFSCCHLPSVHLSSMSNEARRSPPVLRTPSCPFSCSRMQILLSRLRWNGAKRLDGKSRLLN